MRLATYSPVEFDRFSPTFNQEHEGWLVHVEERTPDLSRGQVEVGIPVSARRFVGLTREPDRIVMHYLGLAGEPAHYDVSRPLGLRRVLTDGDEEEFRVEDWRGRTTRFLLRRAN